MKRHQVGFGIAIAMIVCVQPFALGQEPTSNVKTPGKGDAVIVKGCLTGPTLASVETVTTDDTGRTSAPLTYQLKGDKALLKRMREEHDGKVVEVTGVLKSPLPHDNSQHGKTMGKTKVTFGIGTPPAQKGAPDLQSALPVLEVKSYDGAGARCGG
jgi:hypothetical protein